MIQLKKTSIRLLNNNIHNPYFYDLDDSSIKITLHQDPFKLKLTPYYYYKDPYEEQSRINKQLTNYIEFRKELAHQSKLGVFGKILGYSNEITTFILVVIHFIKYREVLY